jgi:endonuclease/exonuclease/phosphatase family metal-dependent hydrolase
MISFLKKSKKIAPSLLGVVFLAVVGITGTSCDPKRQTPEWDQAAPSLTEPPPAATAAAPAPATLASSKPSATTTPSAGLRFIAYNVENWLNMDRYVDKKNLKDAPKPENEKQAVISLLARHSPDVIGLCEIGQATDLAEIQERLKSAGLNLPHSHYAGGSDPTRHLGLLSRYPIISTARPAETEYRLAGQTFAINRGILDATVQANDKPYRFIGIHLKSKRDSEQGDQEAIRLNEARLLRRHVDSILSQDIKARLIVYGDFNDTRASAPLKLITGNFNDPDYLTAIPAKDSRNDAWTHHWAPHDIYSRIDLIMASQGIRQDVDFQAARIIDDPDWNIGSDHRAILAVFR